MLDIYTTNKAMSLFDRSYIDFEELQAILQGRFTLADLERTKLWA